VFFVLLLWLTNVQLGRTCGQGLSIVMEGNIKIYERKATTPSTPENKSKMCSEILYLSRLHGTVSVSGSKPRPS